MLSEYWQEILQDQILGDPEKKDRFLDAVKTSVYCAESCKIEEGEILNVLCKTTEDTAFKVKTVNTIQLKLIHKYPHFALFENLNGKAVNNFYCFSYLDTERLRRGRWVPEIY